ncbi:cyclophilin peptidyl-prolyl cis-trans isomerase Cyp8 [Kickxella alabastrina]|nr:cyclophilin peptidyl-prolyl cis-trans isomerase Cyp8 [Kickxella alabastrina]
MGRWTDKPFISQGEWSNSHGDEGMAFGGKNSNLRGKKETTQQLPFDCCALSLKPFANPVCTPDGYVFDFENITSYIKDHSKHPFTGEPLKEGDLTQLHYHKNADGDYIDPVSFKQLSGFTKIVANRKSGHVYSWPSVEEFNIKPSSWTDLVTSEPFAHVDIVVLQDPSTPKKASKALADTGSALKVVAQAKTKDAHQKDVSSNSSEDKANQPYNAASYSKGLAAASFTSTSMVPVTNNESQIVDSEEYMFGRIKDKGYARIVTNLGDINLELHCDKAPRTCYNFIKLATIGYYKGIKFHRSIKNFMIQGGDPTGTGCGGKSYWGNDFSDEISKKLSHSERGTLAMANRGPGTNGSQFFILYRAAKHLDGKHTVFGRVVGGLPVLSKMEAVPTDDDDHPASDIVIKDIVVFVDPYSEFNKRLERKLDHDRDVQDLASGKRRRTAAEEEQRDRETTTWMGTKIPSLNKTAGDIPSADKGGSTAKGVGKYMKRPRFELPKSAVANGDSEAQSDTLSAGQGGKRKPPSGYKFGNFSGW